MDIAPDTDTHVPRLLDRVTITSIALVLSFGALWLSGYVHPWSISSSAGDVNHRRFIYVHHGTLTIAGQAVALTPADYPVTVDVSRIGQIRMSYADGGSSYGGFGGDLTTWTISTHAGQGTGSHNSMAYTERYRALLVSLGFVTLLCSTPLIARAIQIHRAQRRARVGTCRECGYDLRATPQRCPECGAIPTMHAER